MNFFNLWALGDWSQNAPLRGIPAPSQSPSRIAIFLLELGVLLPLIVLPFDETSTSSSKLFETTDGAYFREEKVTENAAQCASEDVHETKGARQCRCFRSLPAHSKLLNVSQIRHAQMSTQSLVHIILKKGLLRPIRGDFFQNFQGEVCRGYLGGFFGLPSSLEKTKRKIHPKIHSQFKSEFVSFAAKIHNARICP